MTMERDWASLERGLLRDIFVRITADVDAVHFRRVCRGWRVGAGAGAPVPRPWFILKPANGDGAPQAFVRSADRCRRARVRPVPSDAAAVTGGRVRGASRGWLAVTEGKRLLLRDPVSRVEVPLPAFDAGHQMFDVFLSDDPLAAPGGWTAFAFFRTDDGWTGNPGDVLAFFRSGDAEWARVDPDNNNANGQEGQQMQMQLYRGLEFFGGRPYVLLAKPNRLAVCDVEARRLVVSSVNLRLPPDWEWEWDWHWQQQCLVECGGDLLMVHVAPRLEYRSSFQCLGSHFLGREMLSYVAKASKIVLDADGSGMPVASEEVASTGDYALFVAPHGHAFALPASGFPAVRARCVYGFAIDYPGIVGWMVVIDLQSDPSRRDEYARKVPLAGRCDIPFWFCPRPVLDTTSPRRRRWKMHATRNAFPFLK